MYCLARLCRICVTKDDNMKSLYSLDTDSVSFYNKLLTCVPELKSENLVKESLLCSSCCNKLSTLYAFRNCCVKNKNLFEGYLLQLTHGEPSEKRGDLVVRLKDLYPGNNPKKKRKMTGSEEVLPENSFIFDMSPADELRVENCTFVSTSPLNETDRSDNIADLSHCSSKVFSPPGTESMNVDSNTDGDLSRMVESVCVDMSQENYTSDAINTEHNESQSSTLGNDVSPELNITQTPKITKKNNSQNNFKEQECPSCKPVQNATVDTHYQLFNFQNSDIRILEANTCDLQILDLLQNPDVQILISSNIDPKVLNASNSYTLQNTFQSTQIININNPAIERIESNSITRSESLQTVHPQLEVSSSKSSVAKTQQFNTPTKLQQYVNVPKIEQFISPAVPITKDQPSSEKMNVERTISNGQNLIENVLQSRQVNMPCELTARGLTNGAQPPEQPEKISLNCDICGKTYKDQGNLKKHKYLVHEAQPTFKCDFCGKLFKTNYRCRHHMKQHLSSPKGPILCRCSLCGEQISAMSVFEAHARTHEVPVSLACILCAGKFERTADFERHMVSHSSNAGYKCQLCALHFDKLNDLKMHERSHTGGKLYICPYCGRNYCNKNSLNRHVAHSHASEKHAPPPPLLPDKHVSHTHVPDTPAQHELAQDLRPAALDVHAVNDCSSGDLIRNFEGSM